MRPRVSVLSSCYRMTDYLASFLDSLRGQSLFPDFEVLLDLYEPSAQDLRLVEEASKQYGELLRVFVNKDVKPLPTAWNRCIDRAKSDYLCIWNIDDRRTPRSLEVQRAAFDANEVPIAVSGPFAIVSNYGSVAGKLIGGRPKRDIDLHRGMHLGPFFMFRKDTLDSVGRFDEQLLSGADYDFALRLASHGAITFCDESLGFFLNAGEGTSTRIGSRHYVERTAIEIRYDMYDLVDVRYLKGLSEYAIPLMRDGDRWISVRSHVGPSRPESAQGRYSVFSLGRTVKAATREQLGRVLR